MKLSTRNLLLLFGVLIVAFAIVQFTKRDNRSRSLRTELVSIDTAKVTRIEISSPDNEVVLSNEQGWMVSVNDRQKKAKEGIVPNLLNNLNTIQPSRLAAKSKDQWEEYKVDTAGTRVKVFAGNELLSDIVIGRFGVEGQRNFYTYVRLSEDENTYVADGFMGMNVKADASSYRNNTIMRLQKDSLISVTFDYPDSAFMLSKSGRWMINDQPADSASVEKFLRGLSYVNSTKFTDGDIIGTPTHKVSFSFTDRENMVIEAFYSENGYQIKSTENPEEAFMDPTITEKLLKSPNDFF